MGPITKNLQALKGRRKPTRPHPQPSIIGLGTTHAQTNLAIPDAPGIQACYPNRRPRPTAGHHRCRLGVYPTLASRKRNQPVRRRERSPPHSRPDHPRPRRHHRTLRGMASHESTRRERKGRPGEHTRIAQQNIRVAEEGQITERFTKAIDQLAATDKDGNPEIEVRLGGIYALERIARDSERDHWTVMEVLTAYGRKNAAWKNTQEARSEVSDDTNETPSDAAQPAVEIPELPIDIQAILTVLGRRERGEKREQGRNLNLSDTDLRRVMLPGAHLENAGLIRAHLEEAYLIGTHLEGAYLIRCPPRRGLPRRRSPGRGTVPHTRTARLGARQLQDHSPRRSQTPRSLGDAARR